MTLRDSCGCPAGRPLGAPHLPDVCSLAGTATPQLSDEPAGEMAAPAARQRPQLVQVYRNPQTQRPVAVPDEIVSAAEREYRAWKLHTAGVSWNEIATREKYEDAQAAREAVKRYLEEAVAVVQDFSREEIVADHIGRLALMRHYAWKGVEAGKTASIAAALAIEDRWVKAFGLDQVEEGGANQQTVVVPSEEYVRELRLADEAGQGEAPAASAG